MMNSYPSLEIKVTYGDGVEAMPRVRHGSKVFRVEGGLGLERIYCGVTRSHVTSLKGQRDGIKCNSPSSGNTEATKIQSLCCV